jgi:hypothetical protein
MTERRLPALVAQADWSTDAKKRWMAVGRLAGGSYELDAPELVGDPSTLLGRLQERAAAVHRGRAVIAGFDFPIGFPREYARLAGVDRFLDVLPFLGAGRWADFYDVATSPDEISLERPFYPLKPGGTTHQQLIGKLAVDSMNDLRRECDFGKPDRNDACAIFWTLGGNQVGRGAIAGWRDVLAPALRSPGLDIAFWPFDGDLDNLLRTRGCVIVETYPAEACLHLGMKPPGSAWGKKRQDDRKEQGERLLAWAHNRGVRLNGALVANISDGFGVKSSGEDPFDAVVGLMSMIEVLLGMRPPGPPSVAEPPISTVENWIFGQAERSPGPAKG